MKAEQVEKDMKDPLIEIINAQSHMHECMANVTKAIVELKNELASVKRQRNELKGKVAVLEKNLQESNDTHADLTSAMTSQNSACKDKPISESESSGQDESTPQLEPQVQLGNEDSNQAQESQSESQVNQVPSNEPQKTVPNNKESLENVAMASKDNAIVDDNAVTTEVENQVSTTTPEDLLTSSEDEQENMMEVDNDPEAKKKKSADEDRVIDEIINMSSDSDNEVAKNHSMIENNLASKPTRKRKHLRSVGSLFEDSEESEDEIEKLLTAQADQEQVEVKTEAEDDNLEDLANAKFATSDENNVDDEGNATEVKMEQTDPEDQESDVQGVDSIARSFVSDMEKAFIHNFMRTKTRKQADKYYCKPCEKSYHPNALRVHVKEYHLRPGSMYKCPKPNCDITRRNRNTFVTHVYKRHPELRGQNLEQWIVYPCPSCKQNMKSKEERREHVTNDHPHLMGGGPGGRPDSESGNSTNSILSEENAERATVSKPASPKRDFNMFFKENVKKKGGEFLCKICGRGGYLSQGGMAYHIKEKHFHAGAKYNCQQCGKTMNSEMYLRKHYSDKHPNYKVDVDNCRVTIES